MTPPAKPHPWRWRAPLLVALIVLVASAGAFLALRRALPADTPSPTATRSLGVAAATSNPTAAASGPQGKLPPAALCESSQVSSGTVQVCISGPAPRSTVSGVIPFEAKLTGGSAGSGSGTGAAGGSGGVQRANYLIDGKVLLVAFQAPYRIALNTALWPDGLHRIGVTLTTRDGLTTSPGSVDLVFNNGVSTAATAPGSGRPFHPTPGTAASGGPFVVAATGDGASGEKGETETVAQIASWKPNLFLYLGDVYDNGRLEEFDNWYGTTSSQGMYGAFRDITDPTVGNHEYQGNDAPGYFGYWQGIGHYYSFDAGGWHFISLDANVQYGQDQPGTAQYDWLKNDLSSHAGACTIAYWHQPVFNAGTEPNADNMQAIWQLLGEQHVAMVLNGHDHDYQRWQPLDGSGQPSATGISEFVVGSGGHGHQAEHHPDARLAASDWKDFGALKLTLGSTAAQFQFVTSTGAVTDSGSVACHGGVAAGNSAVAMAGMAAAADGLPDAAMPGEPAAARRTRGARRSA